MVKPERVESGSQRFRAVDRIRDARDYGRSRRAGRRASTSSLAVEITRTGRRSRLGLVVSRKVGDAVTRNRVKRMIREWFRRNRAGFGGGIDLVVIPRSKAAQLETGALWRDLDGLVCRGPQR